MPAATTTATLRDNRLFVQYRRRERVDANTTDTSTLARLPLDVISNALSYLPSRQLTNVVKNVNARYKELAMPLLTQRLFWLERELAHDMWELVSEYDYAGRRHYYQELAPVPDVELSHIYRGPEDGPDVVTTRSLRAPGR